LGGGTEGTVIRVLLSLALMAGTTGCSMREFSEQDKLQMVAALVGHDLSDPQSYLAANAPDFVFFLDIEGRDPPGQFLSTLTSPKAEFRAGSEFKEGAGMRFSVSTFEPRRFCAVDVGYGFYCGMLCASSNTALLRYSLGRWIVISTQMNWISNAPPPNKALQLAGLLPP
jgi:hypothetical protein